MTIFKLPDLGEGLPDAEIHEWYVKVGDEVKADQPLVSMETAKAVVDVPSPHAGRVAKLYGKPGDIIETGSPLIAFESDTNESAGETAESEMENIAHQNIAEDSLGVETIPATRAVKAAPAIRALANKLKVDLNTIQPTGPHGTITTEDVNRAAGVSAAPTPAKGEALHSARRAMAINMAKAHAEVVPVTLIEDADIHKWPKDVDITLRIIKAIITACAAEPELNAHFYGQTLSRQLFKEVNLGIAVDTPAGLYVPVIKDANKQSTEALRATVNEFKNKAKSQSFSPKDLHDATITLSNFGTISGRYSNPIVMPPTVAIIGIGKTRQSVVPVGDKFETHPIMPVCLTFDHRAVTGGEAARFMAALIKSLEE